ncbi:MAG: tRNA 2-thiouridine(34) synthase MnmA [Clostridia bacterium]|nr:tRNA 2-thiouridine(34) synthase MnmA [Clostridia bacterium]
MKALIAMSGGVDSAVAAMLMQERGWDCIGCTMRLYDAPSVEGGRTCCSLDDVEDARSVANRLGIPFYAFNYKEDFRKAVIDPFIRAYQAGRTPNPCIDCNREMKFSRLHLRAQELGCDAVVTGHYARVEADGDRFLLKKALDPEKDQSYVLYALTQEQLARTVFPLGTLTKPEVRAIAAQHGFRNAQKPDSQDICFVPDGDYARVIEQYTGESAVPGDYLSPQGDVLGRHRGIIHYTIGQRKGLGVAFGRPKFVCGIDPARNAVILGDAEDLFQTQAVVREFHWISGEAPAAPIRCKAKIRYRQTETACTVTPAGGGIRIEFDQPQRAITPGQAAVLYDGEIVLGGGEITGAGREAVL